MVNANMNEVQKYLSTLNDDEYEQVCMNALVYGMTDGYMVDVPTNCRNRVMEIVTLLDKDNTDRLRDYLYEYLTDYDEGFEEWYEENV